MAYKLPNDCLNEIFECLENKVDLRSCMLVKRSWCKVGVRILWRDIQNYRSLIASFPTESNQFLRDRNIIISSPTTKPILFDYVAFVKNISIYEIDVGIQKILGYNKPLKNLLLAQEIFIVLMARTTLKTIHINFFGYKDFDTSTVTFTTFKNSTRCLENLTELSCISSLHSTLFHHLSEVCQSIRTLNIIYEGKITSGLFKLISVQRNLKYFNINDHCYNNEDLTKLEVLKYVLKRLPDSLIGLEVDFGRNYLPMNFHGVFPDLQELSLSFISDDELALLQFVTFPRLRTLKLNYNHSNNQHLIVFLRKNGKNLEELQLGYNFNRSLQPLNLIIAKVCLKLKSLRTVFKMEELKTLRMILKRCNRLERIEVHRCHDPNELSEGKILGTVAKFSPKKFHELKIHYPGGRLKLFTTKSEADFIKWADNTSHKPLSLTVTGECNDYKIRINVKKEDMKIIEKLKKLRVIGEFNVIP